MLKKNAEFEAKIVNWSKTGNPQAEVLGKLFEVNPRHAMPGDTVRIRILSVGNLEARVLELLSPSPNRLEARCPHFGFCGGCSYQHVPYKEQIEIKRGMVSKELEAFGLATHSNVEACIPSERSWEYRNKMEYTFSSRVFLEKAPAPGEEVNTKQKALGFFAPFSGNKVIDLKACSLQAEPAKSVRNWFRAYAEQEDIDFYNGTSHTGFLRTLLFRNTKDGSTLVMLVCQPLAGPASSPTLDDENKVTKMLSSLKETFPELDSIWYCWNSKLNDSYSDLKPRHFSGTLCIKENFDGLEYRIGPLSFMQVNPWQTEKLYNKIVQRAEIRSTDIVYDLYCGAGTISAYAARLAKKVIGIEYVEEAVEHAREAAYENNLDNTCFFAGDMKNLLTNDFITTNGFPDVIITDPPRAGMHKDVLARLLNLKPRILVYVSCKPESLARDLKVLCTAYSIQSIVPIDLMPHTPHTETLVTLVPRTKMSD